MASGSSLSLLKSRPYTKLRLINVKFHFGHMILYLKSRIYCIEMIYLSEAYSIMTLSTSTQKGHKFFFKVSAL